MIGPANMQLASAAVTVTLRKDREPPSEAAQR